MRNITLLIGLCLLWSCTSSTPTEMDQAAETTSFQVLTRGEVIDLAPHVKLDTITVFDFYADWCLPCAKLDHSLKDMKKIYGDGLTVHKLDIVKWGSDLTNHFKINDLPYLIVYDRDGKLVTQGPSIQVFPKLMEVLNKK